MSQPVDRIFQDHPFCEAWILEVGQEMACKRAGLPPINPIFAGESGSVLLANIVDAAKAEFQHTPVDLADLELVDIHGLLPIHYEEDNEPIPGSRVNQEDVDDSESDSDMSDSDLESETDSNADQNGRKTMRTCRN
jgi:hypothetical protein